MENSIKQKTIKLEKTFRSDSIKGHHKVDVMKKVLADGTLHLGLLRSSIGGRYSEDYIIGKRGGVKQI